MEEKKASKDISSTYPEVVRIILFLLHFINLDKTGRFWDKTLERMNLCNHQDQQAIYTCNLGLLFSVDVMVIRCDWIPAVI